MAMMMDACPDDFQAYTTVPLTPENTISEDQVTLVGFRYHERFCFQGYTLVGAVEGSFSVYNFILSSNPLRLSLHPCFAPSCYSVPVIQCIDYSASTPSSQASAIGEEDASPPMQCPRILNVSWRRSAWGNRIQRLKARLLSRCGPALAYDGILVLADFSWSNLHAVQDITPEFMIFDPRDKERESAGLTAHPQVPVPKVYPIMQPTPHLATVYSPASWQTALQTIFLEMSAFQHLTTNHLAFFPSVLVAGHNAVGKSTFNRMAVNVLVSSFEQVAFMDLDPGQTEFTEPGVLALSLLDFPVLGPGYMHRPPGPPLCAQYLGSVSPQAHPELYMQHVATLVSAYRAYAADLWHTQRRIVPLVVNSMGWVRGLGYELLKQLVAEVAPSHLVAIKSADRGGSSLDMDDLLQTPAPSPSATRASSVLGTSDNGDQSNSDIEILVDGNGSDAMDEGSDGEVVTAPSNSLSAAKATAVSLADIFPKRVFINAVAVAHHQRKLNASDLRILSTAFALLARNPGFRDPDEQRNPWLDAIPLTSPQYPTYSVPLSNVQVVMAHAEVPYDQVLYALNATLVGLVATNLPDTDAITGEASSSLPQDDGSGPSVSRTISPHQYLGLGIVRAISGSTANASAGNTNGGPGGAAIAGGNDPGAANAERMLYLATSVQPALLSHATTVVRGDMELPNWLMTWGLPFVSANRPQGPYTTFAPGEGAGAVANRLRRGVARKAHANVQAASVNGA